MGKYLATWTHEDRTARRKRMAELVDSGESLGSVAGEFGVTTETVRKACRENGVVWPSQPVESSLAGKSYQVIADLCNTGDTLKAIAAKYGVTHQRIGQIYGDCVRAGIPVVPRGPGKKASKPEGD